MKIAIFTDTFLPQTNGVVQSILNNIEYFTKKGHKVWVFAPGKKYEIERKKKFNIFRTFSVPSAVYPESRTATIAVGKFKEIFEKEKFDIIHCHTQFYMGVNGLILSQEYKVPAVSTYHTLFESYTHYVDVIPLPKSLTDLRSKTLYYFLKMFHDSFYKTIVPTKTLSDYLKEKRDISTIVLSNSIDFGKQKNADIRKKYSIPKGARIILYAGRIGKEKNIDPLLDAYKLIQDEKTYLLIAGFGPHKLALSNRVEDESIKNVIFTEKFPSEIKKAIYSSCTFFVSASESETQGMTFIEAMMCGKPVIGIRAQGAIDVIQDNKNGYLVESGNAILLAFKMKWLLENRKLIKKFGKASRKIARQYTVPRVGEQMLALYRDAIKNHKIDPHTRTHFLRFLITRNPRTLKKAFEKLSDRLQTGVQIT